MINAYLQGKLNHEEMHRLEKQALTDPFLWEALEGYEHTSDPDIPLSILQRQLQERVVNLQENKKVFDFTWQRLSVAASASVLFITAGILFWMSFNRSGNITERQVDVSLINRDSLNNEIQGLSNRPVFKAKEYPASSGETRISAHSSASETNSGSELNTASPSTKTNNASASTITQADRFGVQEQGTDASALSASGGIGITEQTVQPVPGWDIYRKYVEENIRKPSSEPIIGGSVLLSFELNEKGKPINFNIIKGLTDACNAEAIRLVKEGPVWRTRVESKNNTGRIEIRF